jgi:hypothetical protein
MPWYLRVLGEMARELHSVRYPSRSKMTRATPGTGRKEPSTAWRESLPPAFERVARMDDPRSGLA